MIQHRTHGAQVNLTGLVGTEGQVAEAIMDYYDLGISTFLIRKHPLRGCLETPS